MRHFLPLLILALVLAGSPAAAQQGDRFDHVKHAKVFPSCTACHQGAEVEGAPLLPIGRGCVSCHDGIVEKRVTWVAPASRRSNLRFTHGEHRRKVAERAGSDSTLGCTACHTPEGGRWMTVEAAVTPQCLSCHGIRTPHLAAADTACATCHLTLAEATTLTTADVKGFPKPPSHDATGFLSAEGHGRQAGPVQGKTTYRVAPSCATCHAQDFCITCHVDAPETATIQALAPDPRSLAIPASLKAPASHAEVGFMQDHGKEARSRPAACQTCHTRESCLACHAVPPKAVGALYASGPGRGAGAHVVRRPPSSHAGDFGNSHAAVATSNPASCQGCHTRPQCLDCHRGTPDGASQYHSGNFLARHPAAAYARETNCSDCHNPGAFCQTCHVQSGVGSPKGALATGYHDAFPGFSLNHGQAARQNLESCTSCHTERDCLTCHSALYGRGFNPHGPGFDADRLRQKNPQMCSVCHGRQIPGGN